MSIFQGGNGYQGNENVQVPSGGGSYKFTPGQAPVPGIYSGSCPGDPGCPGRDTEYTGQNGWSDVGKVIALKATGALIDKYLTRSGGPTNRPPDTGSKGNMASSVEKVPSIWDSWSGLGWDEMPMGAPKAPPATGNGATVNPGVIAGLMLLAVLVLAFMRRG